MLFRRIIWPAVAAILLVIFAKVIDPTPLPISALLNTQPDQPRSDSSSELVVLPMIIGWRNNPPVAADDHNETAFNTPLVVDAANGVLANDFDPDQDQMQVVLVDTVSHGTLALNADGSFDYVPESGFQGEDSFTYVARDHETESNPAFVTIVVGPSDLPNQPPQIISGEIAFTKQVLDDKVINTHYAVAADLDNDGDNDITATNYDEGEVYWYENDGHSNFTKHVLDDDLFGAYPISVGDVDSDGDSDILAGGYDGDQFVWYRNDGGGSLVRIDIDSSDGAHSINTSDLDEDGDNDLITTSQDAGIIAWYENDGAENFALHVVDTTAVDAKYAQAVDFDDDGDLDIMTASFGVDEIAWLENDGQQNFTKHVITNKAIGAYFVNTGDVDGDGDLDVFSASRVDGRFAWYRNNGNNNFDTIDIDKKAAGARTIIATDLDRDGDVDAVGAALNTERITGYLNDGTGKFKKLIIDPDSNGTYGVFAIDFDFDGDIDITSARKIGNEVSLHTQIRAHSAVVSKGGTLLIDTARLQTVDVDDGPAALVYTVIKAPAYGSIRLNGIELVAGGTFTQADIDSDRLSYVNEDSAARRDGFSFQVVDGGENGVLPATGEFRFNFENSQTSP